MGNDAVCDLVVLPSTDAVIMVSDPSNLYSYTCPR